MNRFRLLTETIFRKQCVWGYGRIKRKRKSHNQMNYHFLRRTLRLILTAGMCVSMGAPLMAAEKPAAKPNILFIMLDDLGKEWVSCYGAEDIQTPNIDALAAGGMRFDNAYSMPSCTPSRTTVLSGKYPWRTEIGRAHV